MTNWRYRPESLGALAVLLTLAQIWFARTGLFPEAIALFAVQAGLYAGAVAWRDRDTRHQLATLERHQEEDANVKAAVAEHIESGPDLAELARQFQTVVAQQQQALQLPDGLPKRALALSNDVLAYWGAREAQRPVSEAWGLPPEDQARAWALERQAEERYARDFFVGFSQDLMPRLRAMLEELAGAGLLTPSDKQMQSILLGFNDAFHQPDDVRVLGERLGAVALRQPKVPAGA